MKRKGLLFLVGCIISQFLFSQDQAFRINNYTYRDGLQDKFFYDMSADKSGLLWFGAGNGIYSYDGIGFRLYKPQHPQNGQVYSSLIRSLYYDRNGLLWTAGINQLQWFNPSTKAFRFLNRIDKSTDLLLQSVINCFYRDNSGTMWMGTQKNGIALFSEKDSTTVFIKASQETGASANFITRIVETNSHQLWALSVDGVHLFSKEKGVEKSFRATRPGKNPVDENYFIDGFYDAKMNCIWIASYGGGIVKFSLLNYSLQHFDITLRSETQVIPSNGVSAIAEKSDTEIWFSSGDLAVFNKQTNKVTTHINYQPANEFGFKTTAVQKIKQDKEGNLWVSSFNGLCQIPWQNSQWTTIPLIDAQNNNAILEPVGVCKLPGTNNLLVATSGATGLGFYNSEQKKFSVVPVKEGHAATAVFIHAGNVYTAADNDLHVYNATTKKFLPLNVRYKGEKLKGPIWRLLCDSSGTVYIVSPQNGFYTYNLQSKQVQHFGIAMVDPVLPTAETDNSIWPSLITANKEVYLTRSRYLYRFIPGKNKFEKIAWKTTPAVLNPIEVVEDNAGHLWITTKSNGIYEYYVNRDGKEVVKNYTNANTAGIPTDYFLRVVKDEQGMLWFGSLSGLVKFNPLTKNVEYVFRKKHGLVNDNVDVPLAILPGNELIVCNFGALNSLKLNNYKKNTHVPVPILTSFKIMDREVVLPFADSINIKTAYNQNFLQIQFAALAYNNSDENRYAYMLEGAEKKWTYSNRNYVSYSGLAPGTYVFHLKAANNDGIWSNNQLQLTITVTPPFWKTYWFIGGLLMLISGTAIWLYRMRIAQVRKEAALKAAFQQQLAETEMKALRAQMNPHFIFNSLNSIQGYILRNEHFEASQYLSKFSKLIRLILDQSNANTITLGSELELLQLYTQLEKMRFGNSFSSRLVVDPQLDTERILIPSMLLQPYVENAIWHGLLHKDQAGELVLQFTKANEQMLEVIIEDNGVGRAKAAELKSKQVLRTKSYGMQITSNRLRLINQLYGINATSTVTDLVNNEGEPCGTRVSLQIPIK